MSHRIDLGCYMRQLDETTSSDLLSVIKEGNQKLVGRLGIQVAVPQALCELLVALLNNPGEQQATVELEEQDELTIGSAAKMLGVSAPHLRKILADGDVPFHMVGSHRRIYTADLLKYKRLRDSREQHVHGESSSEPNPDSDINEALPEVRQFDDEAKVLSTNADGSEAVRWQSVMEEWDSEYDGENYHDL